MYDVDFVFFMEELEVWFVKNFCLVDVLGKMYWFNFYLFVDKVSIYDLGEKFGWDCLLFEDIYYGICCFWLEEYGNYVFFFIVFVLFFDKSGFLLKKEWVFFVLGENYLIFL